MFKMAVTRRYDKNYHFSSSLELKGQLHWALVCSVSDVGPSKFSNDDPMLILTYIMLRSNLFP